MVKANEADNTNVDAMANCGLGFLDLKKYTSRTAFNNKGYGEAKTVGGRADHEHLACVACKPGYTADPNL